MKKFVIIIPPPQDIACQPDLQHKLATGDREAFAWVYKNYCKKVYDYAILVTNNEQQSEDIVQEVFLRLWIKREKLSAVKDFNSYLFIIGRNITANFLRRQSNDNYRRVEFAKTQDLTVYPQYEKTISVQVGELLNNAVKQLPPRRQLVYRLRRENGWPLKKIAQELQISRETVKTHMQDGLKYLKDYIKVRMKDQ
ncbi:MAG TPA: sigma-70 family RNA polymerase sigma factor [Chitinophagaceae bacterium]|nr:sigma-70 family RNA polymerase sigma factor [Chitinophagaceae bacterium]